MILLFASSLQDFDPQITLLKKELANQGKPFVSINPLQPRELKDWSLENNGGVISVMFRDSGVEIDTVYLSRLWRTDCVIDLPVGCLYPTFFRYKIESFLLEMSFALQATNWFPGSLSNIQAAEAKCFLYKEASRCGLSVPEVTINSFGEPKGENQWYRKVLGFPFGITLNQEIGQEVAITLLNNRGPYEDTCFEFPWQWQIYVKPKFHIRCVAVGDKVWCCRTEEEPFGGRSLREVQSDMDVEWTPFKLPEDLVSKLTNLLSRLGLSIACPEFLVDGAGDYVFIDLNPCGDWYGFFDTDTSDEIVRNIVSKL